MRLHLVVLSTLVVVQSAFAGSEELLLKVSGEIAPVPRFVDGQGAPISVLNLIFDGMAKEVPGEAVDSAPVSFRLVGALSYPAQVSFQRPQGCSIGSQSVSDTNVHLQADGTVFATDGEFFIASSSAVSVKLRFANASALSGQVACATDGGFVYSY